MKEPTAVQRRPEAEIFAALGALCSSPGYIHAIAYFCWRDNFIRYSGSKVVRQDLEHQYSLNRLLRTEISTLIGLLVQAPIDTNLPEQLVLQDYVDRTEALLAELHDALTSQWFVGWNIKEGKVPERDPFSSANALREPIFYGGESAYSFQYSDLAVQKYRNDNPWLEANKGFNIDNASKIAISLGNLQSKKLLKLQHALRAQQPDTWTVLSGFTFTAKDLAETSGVNITTVEQFLASFVWPTNELNTSFTGLSEFNGTNAAPILKLEHESYILLQHYSLLEAIYESPFYWMAADQAYKASAFANRGRFTENFVADRLGKVFGGAHVLRNIDIYKGKNKHTEIDTLVLFGDQALVVQSKSKRLTIEARKGNDLQLKGDFKKAIQDAYDQALLCAEALLGSGYKFVDSLGKEIEVTTRPRALYPICVVSDHYPALAFQARQFLRATINKSIQPPLVVDVFAIDAFTEMLASPLQFLNFIALRARADKKLLVSQELTTLGYHLKHNLWLEDKYDMVNLGDDFSSDLDIAMYARRAGVPGEKTPKGILTGLQGTTIGRLLSEIENSGSPELSGLGMLFLQIGSETATLLSKAIDNIVHRASLDGKNHDMSLPANENSVGLTIHCNNLPVVIAREKLGFHCRLRKYDGKAGIWFGLLLEPGTGRIRGALVNDSVWEPNASMDAALSDFPRKALIPISKAAAGITKVGRNELCPCGSGKKYKKCCLNS